MRFILLAALIVSCSGTTPPANISAAPATATLTPTPPAPSAAAVASTSEPSILATYPLPGLLVIGGASAVFDEKSSKLYVGSNRSRAIVAIDPASGTIVSRIALPNSAPGFSVGRFAVNATRSRIYVTTSSGVQVADSATGRVVGKIDVGKCPAVIAIGTTTNRVYVVNADVLNPCGNSVSVIDATSEEILATIPTPEKPGDAALNAATGLLYLTHSFQDTVSVLDLGKGTVIASISVGRLPLGLAVDETRNRVYVSYVGTNEVSVIDGGLSAVVATISVKDRTSDLAFDSGGQLLYLLHPASKEITVIDTAHDVVLGAIALASRPEAITVSRTAHRAYVVARDSNVSACDSSGLATPSQVCASLLVLGTK
jgi:YVTN family beta-propeller protein